VKRGSAARRFLTAVAACVAIAGCTPAGQILFSLLPDGTIPMLLSHLQRESDTNRRRVAELEQKGDWQGLVNLAEENLALQPNNVSWWLVAGYANSRQKNHPRAIQCFQEMVRLEPHAADGWNFLAQEDRAMGEPQRAVDILARAQPVLRDVPVTYLLLGESYSDLGRFELAARAYQQALDLDGGLTPAWAGLARAYIKIGRYADAESIARAAEASNPQFAAAIRDEIRTAKNIQ